jgi:hypothetical protein
VCVILDSRPHLIVSVLPREMWDIVACCEVQVLHARLDLTLMKFNFSTYVQPLQYVWRDSFLGSSHDVVTYPDRSEI